MLSEVSKLKVSNRNNKREVRQLTHRKGQAGGGVQGKAGSVLPLVQGFYI